MATKKRSGRKDGDRAAVASAARASLAKRGINPDDLRLRGLVERFKSRSGLDPAQLLKLLAARKEILSILAAPNPTTKIVLSSFDSSHLLGALGVLDVRVQLALTQMEHSLTRAKPTKLPMVRMLDEVQELCEQTSTGEQWDHVAAVAGLVLWSDLREWQTHAGGFDALCEKAQKQLRRVRGTRQLTKNA